MSETEIVERLEKIAKEHGVTLEYLMKHLEDDIENPL